MIAVRLSAQTWRGSFRFQCGSLSAGSANTGKRAPGWRVRLGAFLRMV